MSRFKQLRDELGELLSNAVEETLPYARTPSAVSSPAMIIVPNTPFARYWTGNGRSTVYTVRVIFILSKIAEETAQQRLDEWASHDGPIIEALYDADLNDAEVLSVTGSEYGRVVVGNAEYIGFSLVVEIEA